jgi:uncharacterized protein (DUF1778 family)
MAIEMVRLDVRLSKKQKELFEEAINLGGYATLTQFMVSAAAEKATSIIKGHRNWLSSERDQKTFFATLASPPEPNAYLKGAVKNYRALLEESDRTSKASTKK